MSEWIFIHDQLPENEEKVAVLCADTKIWVCEYLENHGFNLVDNLNVMDVHSKFLVLINDVTYWTPLPDFVFKLYRSPVPFVIP